ncbi:MAG: S-layer homology domain-containing protein [Actinomycetota bacterium]
MISLLAGSIALVPAATASSGFGDVSASDWYGAPVQWLVDEDITDGVSPGCFGPFDDVSRGQLATFLWRYAGEPSAPAHGFSDVAANRYYNDAVSWLAHTGITTGTSATTFSPEDPITRSMVAAFLWRYAGSPSAPPAGFSDVPAGSFYEDAVDWMVDTGITNGTSATTFSPHRTLNRAEFAAFLYRFDGSPSVDVQLGGYCPTTFEWDPETPPVYSNDFSSASDRNRIDHFVTYRDPWVVFNETGSSDHGSAGGVNCTAPEQTRPQTRDNPYDHLYLCHPGGDASLGHEMAFTMDTSGYGFAGGMPDQVFTNVREVAVDINTTSAGIRNFVEIKVLPAGDFHIDSLPCGPDIPCNDFWDYGRIGGVGASTDSLRGTGLAIHTPEKENGYYFNEWSTFSMANGATGYDRCPSSGYCHFASVHDANPDIRARYKHIFRDNGDGTLSFGIQEANGSFHWVTAPGSFPSGKVRVVIAFHTYTGTKDGNGPGFDNNNSPSTGGFTWHWDNVEVFAESTQSSFSYFGGHDAEHMVVPDYCIAFTQGTRDIPNGTDIDPTFVCEDQTLSTLGTQSLTSYSETESEPAPMPLGTAADSGADVKAFCPLPREDDTTLTA